MASTLGSSANRRILPAEPKETAFFDLVVLLPIAQDHDIRFSKFNRSAGFRCINSQRGFNQELLKAQSCRMDARFVASVEPRCVCIALAVTLFLRAYWKLKKKGS
jgi:hypothetical protein